MFDKLPMVLNMMRMFRGDHEERVRKDHAEKAVGHGNPHVETGDWFNDGVNKMNRLWRPMMIVAVFFLFGWSYVNPEGFTTWNKAINTMGEYLWMLIFLVLSSFLGTKFTRDVKSRTTFVNHTTTHVEQSRKSNPDEGEEDEDDGVEAKPEEFEDIIDEPAQTNTVVSQWRERYSEMDINEK